VQNAPQCPSDKVIITPTLFKIVSVLWEDILSDLSYDSQIQIWSDTLPKIAGQQNVQN